MNKTLPQVHGGGDFKDNSTMNKTEAKIVSYGILYLNPSSHQCQTCILLFQHLLTDTK